MELSEGEEVGCCDEYEKLVDERRFGLKDMLGDELVGQVIVEVDNEGESEGMLGVKVVEHGMGEKEVREGVSVDVSENVGAGVDVWMSVGFGVKVEKEEHLVTFWTHYVELWDCD